MTGWGPAERTLTFVLLDEEYTLRLPRDGRTLCAWAAVGQWPQIIPGLLDRDSHTRLLAHLTDPTGPVGWRVCWRATLGLSDRIFGVPWWTAGRLAHVAHERWTDYAAWTVAHGFDPAANHSAHRLCSSVLAWLRSGVHEEKDAHRLNAQLFDPPPELRRRKKVIPRGFSPEEQAAAYAAARAELGTGQ